MHHGQACSHLPLDLPTLALALPVGMQPFANCMSTLTLLLFEMLLTIWMAERCVLCLTKALLQPRVSYKAIAATAPYLFYRLGRHFAFMHDLHNKDLVVSPPPALEGLAKGPLSKLLQCLILDVECAPACNIKSTGFGPPLGRWRPGWQLPL